MTRTFSRKLASALATVGLGVSLTAGVAAASPGTASASSSSRLSGAGGQTTGTLVPAGKSLSTFWNQFSSSARDVNVVSTASSKAQAPAQAAAPKPQGRAVRIAGTTGSVAQQAKAAVPQFGSGGTGWYGNFWSAPATTTGKIFFSDHLGGRWVCSGSLVNSAGKDLVITAGHCVYGTAGGELPAGETWHSNWVFAPDYSNGWAPYGYWTSRQLWTLTNYINNGDEQDDLGAALLNANSSGTKAVNLLGGQGIAWNQSSTQFVFDFGYPAASPFNGQTLQYCTGTASYGFFNSMENLPCNFTGGSSGGPWLMSFNGTWGYVNSVNDANGYFFYPGQMGGLYFGNNAANLYNTVAPL